MAPNVPLALVLLAVAAAALRAAARRPGPPQAPGTGPAPVTVLAGQSQPRPAGTPGWQDGAGGELARASAPPGRPASAVDQARHIFHELHADGRHTFCTVCDSQYGAA
jgi:hypothetical protein